MKKIAFLGVFAIVRLGSVMAQDKIASDKQIPILAWAGIPAGETNVERFKELKDMGIKYKSLQLPDVPD